METLLATSLIAVAVMEPSIPTYELIEPKVIIFIEKKECSPKDEFLITPPEVQNGSSN